MARMEFKITVEPYASRVIGNNDKTVNVDGNGIMWFDADYIYDMAKATGLKSNKKRHINKRFKIVIHQALRAGLEGMDE